MRWEDTGLWLYFGDRADNIHCRPGCKIGRGKNQSNQLLGFWFEQLRVCVMEQFIERGRFSEEAGRELLGDSKWQKGK